VAILTRWSVLGLPIGELVSTGSIDGVKGGILAENAIGILPDYAVRQDIVDGRLAEIVAVGAPPGGSCFSHSGEEEAALPLSKPSLPSLPRA
jgi:DNA-binding transcriptional LysR family regulator